MTSSLRQAATLGTFWFLAFPVAWGAECERPLSVAQVIRNAQTLDGRIVCVRGMLLSTPVPEWSGELIQELVPFPTRSRKTVPTDRLGLMDWSPETGIDEEYYKPESFRLLSSSDTHGRSVAVHAVDVTFRGAVMYKRNLRAKVPPVPHSTPSVDAMRLARYDVEFVVLEVARAKRVDEDKKKP